MSGPIGTVRVFIALLVLALHAPGGVAEEVVITFTDRPVRLPVDLPDAGPDAEVAATVTLISEAGLGTPEPVRLAVRDGHVEVTPRGEGIHIVAFAGGAERRFLAVDPPEPFDERRVYAALPRSAGRLLDGRPVTLLAMGDSVTQTGDYGRIVAMLLERATGNRRVTVVKRAHAGRSVDAAVREFDREALAQPVNVGLLMYGLNDQAGGVPLAAFLEQYAHVAERLARDAGADCVFLQPTPDIGIPADAEQGGVAGPGGPEPGDTLRTLGFATHIERLGQEMSVPVARTFAALWREEGATLGASARAMWPLYPPHYGSPLRSLVETGGKGDTIHPNALGHALIARAVYRAMMGIAPAEVPLTFEAQTGWRDGGVISDVRLTNASGKPRRGRLMPRGSRETGALSIVGGSGYDLAPGESAGFIVRWDAARQPADLLRFPGNAELAGTTPVIPLVDVANGRTAVYGVEAPVTWPTFVRERQALAGRDVTVRLTDGRTLGVTLPEGADTGRVPLVEAVEGGWAVAELAFVRYASAARGDVTVDGRLDEWPHARWSDIGPPHQARAASGPADRRQRPGDAFMRWSSRATPDGIALAARVTGATDADRITAFLDPRQPEQLGTVGLYFWVTVTFEPGGSLRVQPGETSPAGPAAAGRWTQAEGERQLELLIPYRWIGLDAWPASGDLGCSVWWRNDAGPAPTDLYWSEDGHPWNPRWFGVIRLTDGPAADLPYMIRVK